MAPFLDKHSQEFLTAPQAIQNLGHFSDFRSPAKCAARIGQAFTDTNGCVTVEAAAKVRLKDVERGSRCFSDGCGTISKELADKVTSQYPRLQMKAKPVAFQIRFQGEWPLSSLLALSFPELREYFDLVCVPETWG